MTNPLKTITEKQRRAITLEIKRRGVKPKMVTIYEDMNDPGNFYTTSKPKDGKRLTDQDIKALESDPGIILFVVKYADKKAEPRL